MGQQEVYSLLKRNKARWFSSREAIQKLRLSPGSVITSFTKLRKNNLVYSKLELIPGGKNKRKVYFYRYKR